ncbi:DUF748 domain-containing protein [Marinobacter sp. chi1]|uniref:DUF748 domain-containing protein n=1 Tax=Marinobacter suaedae TaxID=3057675 RepID=A0ABT8VZU1_9GAMM|nr:DUF748 domain-containing protein [Marinobacter sp. chi1]MDO3721516.1 DUF748 domain-containing protein [Marinobacter sp. chi1]
MAESRKHTPLARTLLIVLAVLVLLYAIVGFLILPWWLEKNLPEQLSERMGWQGEISQVSINPFALSVEALGLSAEDDSGEPVLGFDRLFVNLNLFQLVRGIVGFEAIQLQEPFIRLDLLEDYSVNFARDWQTHNPVVSAPEQEATDADQAAPPRLYFGELVIDGGELLFRDFSRGTAQPAEFRITPLDLNLLDLATWRRDDSGSTYNVQAALGDDTIEWQGDLSVVPLASQGSINVSGLGYDNLKHFLAPFLPYDLRGGEISLSADYDLAGGEVFQLTTRNGEVSLQGLALALSPDSELAALSTGAFTVDRITFDLARREAAIGEVSITGLDMALARNESGQIDWLVPLSSGQAPSETSGEPNAESPSAEPVASPFRWSVQGIALADSRIAWRDAMLDTPAELALEQLSLEVGNASHRLDEPIGYQLRATLASGGQFSLDGQVTPQPFTFEGAVAVSGVALEAVSPYVQQNANLRVVNGTLGLDGNLDLDGQQDPLTGTFSGTAEIADLALRLPEQEGELLTWKALRLAPIEYNVSPARLEIGTVTLTQPAVGLIRGANNALNVASIGPQGGAKTGDSGAQPSAAGDTPGFIFRIGQLMLEEGSVAYTDRSLKPPVTTSLDRFSGSVTGLSNIKPQEGKVSLRGRIDKVADLEFAGTIGTLGSDATNDLQLTVDGLSLPQLSPYFSRRLGYHVDSGKMDLNLDYKIAGTRLDANNHVVLDKIELGQVVDSDEAVDAPVALGLAVLKDGDGVIELDLPVSGDLSDPSFSVRDVIRKTFVNLLVKAAAAPFTILGSIVDLAGFTSEELGVVNFGAGSAELSKPEQEKLAALAKGMADRPELILNIRGAVAPDVDGSDLSPNALSNLASERAQVVRNFLAESQGVSPDRLYLLDASSNATVPDEGLVSIDLTLDAR